MKKVITYGTFDLFHEGHVNLLRRAKALGDWLIVGVTTDNFDMQRGKMNTCDNVMERIEAVKACGYADQIIIEEYRGQKIEDIQKYGVDIFAIGSDWEGYFDYLKDYCEVVYLPRTEGISSSQLREERPAVRLGIIGTGSIATRFVPEAAFVGSNKVVAAYNPDPAERTRFCEKFRIPVSADSPEALFAACDAVYIASPIYTHYEYAKQALEAGKHVLCEIPFVLKESEAAELLDLAERSGLVLMPAHKTASCPAFNHLVSLLRSGPIGEIVEVNASVTTLTDERSEKLDAARAGGSMNENAVFPLLPVFKLLGTQWESIDFFAKMRAGVDIFTKAVIRYPHAVASFQVGLGVKTEGNMVVSGTKGYAYVPAPWWKTNYFELRFEDQNLNKKYFYPYDGEGLRYEIKDFVSCIHNGSHGKLTLQEILRMSRVQELFLAGENVYEI